MAISVNDPASLALRLSNYTTGLRDLFDKIDDFSQWLSNLQIADIETAFNVSAADAAVIQSTVGNLESLSKAYQGLGTITPAFNFKANSSALWGGN